MSELTHLTLAYLGMIGAIAIWTWTVFSRSKKLEQKIVILEGMVDSNTNVINSVNDEIISTPEQVDSIDNKSE
tara:strand:- start:11476 stop:11694 length:219 start_codon:yes stop_codon:yes gene_type:complete